MKHLCPFAAQLKCGRQKGNSALLFGLSKVTTVYRQASHFLSREEAFYRYEEAVEKTSEVSYTHVAYILQRCVCVCVCGETLQLTSATEQKNHMPLRWLTPSLTHTHTHTNHTEAQACSSAVSSGVSSKTQKVSKEVIYTGFKLKTIKNSLQATTSVQPC